MAPNKTLDILAEQCYIKTGSVHTDYFDYVKYAELIVRECVEQVEVFNVRMDARPRHIIEAIKEHFGVKE